jgi:hypothetical protein
MRHSEEAQGINSPIFLQFDMTLIMLVMAEFKISESSIPVHFCTAHALMTKIHDVNTSGQ